MELRESKKTARVLLNATTDSALLIDKDGVIIDLNNKMSKALGKTRNDLLGSVIYDSLPSDLAKQRKAKGTEVAKKRKPIHFNDQRTGRWLENSVYPIFDTKRELIRFAIYSRNITDRKKTEEALKAEKDFSESILNALVDTVFVFDPKTGKPLRWNKALNEISGYTDQEISSKKAPDDWYPKEDLKNAAAETEKLLKGKKSITEMSLITKDGRLILTEYSASMIKDVEDNPKYIVAIGRDITQRKQAEEELRKSEAQYKRLVESIPDIVYSFSDKRGGIYNSPSVKKILGYSVDYLHKNSMIWHDSIHPNDLPAVDQAIKRFRKGEMFSLEYRIKDANGNWHWFYDRSIGRQKVNEELIIEGIASDITERKQTEKELYDSRNMLQTILDSIPSAVFWKDRNLYYLGGNRTFLEATGIDSSEKLVGKSDYDLPWEKEQADSFRKDDRRIMESGIPEYDIIEPYLKADGTHAWAKTNKVPLQDMEGNIVGILGTYEDITERKQAEEELIKNQNELKNLTAQLINAQEMERKRLSLELHDEMGQALTAIGINIAGIEKEQQESGNTEVEERLKETSLLVDSLLDKVHEMSLELRPSMLDDLGLIPALRWYINKYKKRSNIEVMFETIHMKERLIQEMETALFRVIQEALTNIIKHAKATEVHIHLEQKKSKIIVIIRDNGKGFQYDKVAHRKPDKRGMGLIGIRERIFLLGGKFDIKSQPGQGTCLSITIPWIEKS